MEERTYSVVIEAFKNMYEGGNITVSKITEMYENKSITRSEYEYILGKGGA